MHIRSLTEVHQWSSPLTWPQVTSKVTEDTLIPPPREGVGANTVSGGQGGVTP